MTRHNLPISGSLWVRVGLVDDVSLLQVEGKVSGEDQLDLTLGPA